MNGPVVAVVAPGMMGAGVGQRLVKRGLKVLTSTAGRSPSTVKRASEAGMVAASDEEILAADFMLSIVPPADAVAWAERFAPALARIERRPVYVDCNAVSVPTAEKIAAIIAATGTLFIDAGIIGSPPKTDDAGPRIYASGPHAGRLVDLSSHGLDIRVLEGSATSASALKMSYGGITKGTQALASVMLLAAARGGAAGALYKELQFSQKEILWWLDRQLAIMPPKAKRWVAEMREIADFVANEPGGADIFEGAAKIYDQIGLDFDSDGDSYSRLKEFLARGKSAK